MFVTYPWLLGLAALVFPLLGGVLTGLDRRVTARLQGRVGPPIWQPFYDVIKLWGKAPEKVNDAQLIWVAGHLAFALTGLLLVVAGQDMLMTAFVLAFASVCLILGGMSGRSPYAQLGGQREIFQVLSYEPLFLLTAVGIFLKTGTFMLGDVSRLHSPLLLSLPLMFVVLLVVGAIKLRKSPFDTSVSMHAHQELVRGLLTEYGGHYLAIVEIAHWVELVMLLALFASFWATSWFGALLLALGGFLFEIVLDNVTSRMTWRWMLGKTWTWGLVVSGLNLLLVYWRG